MCSTALHLAASEGNIHIVELLLDKGANAFAFDRWGNQAYQDAVREGHKAVISLLAQRMDERMAGDKAIAEYAHLEELRKWLLNNAGFSVGKGLNGVLELLDNEGVDTVALLKVCFDDLKPMMRKGPAARLSTALGAGAA